MSAPRRALTLLEVLVALGALTLILATAFPARRSSLAAASAARELDAAKDQLVALRSYASDNRDRIMPSAAHWAWVHQPESAYSLFPRNPWNTSRRMSGSEVKVWTLHLMGAGYLRPETFVVDRATRNVFDARSPLPQTVSANIESYTISSRQTAYAWHPTLGMNAAYVGGAYVFGAFRGQTSGGSSPFGNPAPVPNPRTSGGQFYVQSFDAIKRPSQLIIFASARAGDVINGGAFWNYGAAIPNSGTIRPGHWAVLPPAASPNGRGSFSQPYSLANAWITSNTYNPAQIPGAWGMMDLRHDNHAVTVTADGHAELQTLEQLRDMRKWSNVANKPNWTFPTNNRQIQW
ncbi:MAG: hypothetical protein AB7Q00_07545 [Phycisphaerales bacterium]